MTGTGRQNVVAVWVFVSYYVVALPIGIPLMFLTKLRVTGTLTPEETFYQASRNRCYNYSQLTFSIQAMNNTLKYVIEAKIS